MISSLLFHHVQEDGSTCKQLLISVYYRYYKRLIQVGTEDESELRRYAEKKMAGYREEASRWSHYAKNSESTLDVLYKNLGTFKQQHQCMNIMHPPFKPSLVNLHILSQKNLLVKILVRVLL